MPFHLAREDLRVYRRQGYRTRDICLLIDASASMAGKRIRAAKHLARHLLQSGHDRVAVLSFQEKETSVCVPFTRNGPRVEAGLRRMQPFGLTPLASGLHDCLDYLVTARSRNPLLLLITDGVPTVPRWTMNPLGDAIRAAAEVASRKVSFACIGLEPNRDFLEKLAQQGRGSLYVVEELEKDALVAIAHRERRKAPVHG